MRENIKKICLWVLYAGFGVVLLAPLMLDNRFFFPFIFTKVLIFRVAVEILFLVYLILNFVSDEYRPRLNWVTGLAALFTIVAAVSSALGPTPSASFWGDIERGEGVLLWLHLLAFLLVLGGVARTKQAWAGLLDFSVGVAALMALFGLGQALQIKALLATSGDRVDATLGNAAFFGAYLLFHLAFAAYLFFHRRSWGLKVYYGAVVLLFAFLVPATQTRGAVLGLAVGIVVGAVLFAYARRDNRRVRWASAAVIVLVVALGFGLYLARNQAFVKTVPGLPRILTVSLTTRTAQTRFATWRAAYMGFLERPLLGWGQDNFQIVFNKYFPPVIYEDEGSQVWFDRAHNVIFDRLVATGIAGLLVFLGLLLYPAYYLLRHGLRDPEHEREAIIFASLLMAYFIQDLFIFESAATYIILFLTLGFLGSQYLPAWQWPERALFGRRFVWPVLLIVYAAAFYPILWSVNLYPAKINVLAAAALRSKPQEEDFFAIIDKHKKYLDEKWTYGLPEYRLQFIDFVGQQLAPVGEVVEDVKPVLDYTDRQVERQLAEAPADAKNWLLAMRNYNYTNLSLPEAREERLLKALSFFPELKLLSPTRPHVYQEAGYAYLYRFRLARDQGKQALADESMRAAEENFQKTIDLQPRVYESYSNLIMMYLNSGATDKIAAVIARMEGEGINFRTPERVRYHLNLAKNNRNFYWIAFWSRELTLLEPDNPQAFIDWALGEAYLGRRQQAAQIAEKIKSFGGSYAAQADIFLANVRSGFYEKQVK